MKPSLKLPLKMGRDFSMGASLLWREIPQMRKRKTACKKEV
jgi:hypothetical protein